MGQSVPKNSERERESCNENFKNVLENMYDRFLFQLSWSQSPKRTTILVSSRELF